MLKNSMFIFHSPTLFSEEIKDNIIESFKKSNVVRDKLKDGINKIEFHLGKNNKHEFNISMTTYFLGKVINLNENGDNIFRMVNQLLNKFERTLVSMKT